MNITESDKTHLLALQSGSTNPSDTNNITQILSLVDRILAGDTSAEADLTAKTNAMPDCMLKTIVQRCIND
jgi:hypothetical protein